jgi:alcohol dehydrogenase
VRAAVVYQHGPRDNIVLETNYREPPIPAGWVRLRVGACSVNYHDIFSRRGMPGISLPLPLIIGSDIAGEVVELGSEVRGVAVGDRVLVDPVFHPLGMIGERYDGGRAELC